MDIKTYQEADRIVRILDVRTGQIDDLIILKSKILEGVDYNVKASIYGKEYVFFQNSFLELIDIHLNKYNEEIFHFQKKLNDL